MKYRLTLLASAVLTVTRAHALSVEAAVPVPVAIEKVTISAGRPSSLPTRIPATIEGVSARDIAGTINASDSEDALKYLPSLLIRKRYIGDYNHAVLSTRASGTGNSARSMVYADGILLSNYLGNGAGFAPRWGMVAPEEIERVDVLYGPFSAAYAGNAAGAVVDYMTRMPNRFEAHMKLGYATQRFDVYGARERGAGKHASASMGDRHGRFAWWLSVNRLDSVGQPLGFVTRQVADGTAPSSGVPVVGGAVAATGNKGQDWWVLGTTTRYHTMQDQAKLKLAYDLAPAVRASYTLGWWKNDTTAEAGSYLRDASGQPVYTGRVVIGGRQFNLDAQGLAFAPGLNTQAHLMQGLSVKTTTRDVFDGEIAVSRFDYQRDLLRAPTVSLPQAATGGAGRVTDMDGTGWHNLHLRGIWRPTAAHVIDLGYQQDAYRLRTLVSTTANWRDGGAGARQSAFNGNTGMKSLFAQDSWTVSDALRTTLGARYERWRAWGGELGNAVSIASFGQDREESHVSPKAALAYRLTPAWTIKASAGRAVRMPTVGELYQGSIVGNAIINTDPLLKPEKSWTGELSAERAAPDGMLRVTLFGERTRDALYAQALTPLVSTVQNVDAIRTRGAELAWQASDVGIAGLALNGSATWTDSIISANRGFSASVGKRQPRVPEWRATGVASFAYNDRLSFTLAARYSGKQYGQLDNSDVNGFSYQGFSRFFVADARVLWRLDKHWSAALGVDNLNNYQYWAFHPYARRSVSAELKFDL